MNMKTLKSLSAEDKNILGRALQCYLTDTQQDICDSTISFEKNELRELERKIDNLMMRIYDDLNEIEDAEIFVQCDKPKPYVHNGRLQFPNIDNEGE